MVKNILDSFIVHEVEVRTLTWSKTKQLMINHLRTSQIGIANLPIPIGKTGSAFYAEKVVKYFSAGSCFHEFSNENYKELFILQEWSDPIAYRIQLQF